MQMTDKEKIREAIMRLSMCANRECEICKYKDRPKNELPSETCKERSIKNVSILADEFLRKVNVSDMDKVIRCKECEYWNGIDECLNPYIFMSDGAHLYTEEDDFCSYGERMENS